MEIRYTALRSEIPSHRRVRLAGARRYQGSVKSNDFDFYFGFYYFDFATCQQNYFDFDLILPLCNKMILILILFCHFGTK